MRIASILNEKEITLSCEVFPPKHFDGLHRHPPWRRKLPDCIRLLCP